MKLHNVKYTVILPLWLILACSRHGSASASLPVEQMRPVVQDSFKTADPGTRDAALKVVDDAQNNDIATAFVEVDKLASRRDLTPEQQAAVLRVRRTIQKQLVEAADKGDARATQALAHFRATR